MRALLHSPDELLILSCRDLVPGKIAKVRAWGARGVEGRVDG